MAAAWLPPAPPAPPPPLPPLPSCGRGGADEAEQRLRRPGGQEEEGRKDAPPPPTTRRGVAARTAATLKANMQPYVIRAKPPASATGARAAAARLRRQAAGGCSPRSSRRHAIEAAVLLPNVDITTMRPSNGTGGLGNRGPPATSARVAAAAARVRPAGEARKILAEFLRAEKRVNPAHRPRERQLPRVARAPGRRRPSLANHGRCCAVGRGWRREGINLQALTLSNQPAQAAA